MAWHAVNDCIAPVAMSHGKTAVVSVALVECDARDTEATNAEAVKQGEVHGEASATYRLTKSNIEAESAHGSSSHNLVFSVESCIEAGIVHDASSSKVVFSTGSYIK